MLLLQNLVVAPMIAKPRVRWEEHYFALRHFGLRYAEAGLPHASCGMIRTRHFLTACVFHKRICAGGLRCGQAEARRLRPPWTAQEILSTSASF
jgi:hypothetical protein